MLVFRGRQRSQIPESFRATVDSLRFIGGSAAGILLEKRFATTDDQKGCPVMRGRIFRGLAKRCGVEHGRGRMGGGEDDKSKRQVEFHVR